MTTLQVDKEMEARLTGGREPVVFCGAGGRRIGVFVPDVADAELWERARAAFSDEELDHAEREPSGTTLEEILKRIGAA